MVACAGGHQGFSAIRLFGQWVRRAQPPLQRPPQLQGQVPSGSPSHVSGRTQDSAGARREHVWWRRSFGLCRGISRTPVAPLHRGPRSHRRDRPSSVRSRVRAGIRRARVASHGVSRRRRQPRTGASVQRSCRVDAAPEGSFSLSRPTLAPCAGCCATSACS